MREYGIYNVNRCVKCGVENDDGGEWYWTDRSCTRCSNCFAAPAIKDGGTYLKNTPLDADKAVAYYELKVKKMNHAEWLDTPQDSIKVDLPKSSPHGVLLLTLVESAVDSIRSFIKRRSLAKQLDNYGWNELLDRARLADAWLQGSDSHRIPFKWVCMWHDLDQAKFTRQIYSQFKESDLEEMRRASFRRERVRIESIGLHEARQ